MTRTPTLWVALQKHYPLMAPLLIALALLAAVAPSLHPRKERMVVVQGSVRNERGDPLQGANVYSNELETSIGTDSAGCYSLNLPVAIGTPFTIRVRSVGFKPEVREFLPSADTVIAHFTMRPYTPRDSEIVVGDVIVGNERRKVPFQASRIPRPDSRADGSQQTVGSCQRAARS